MQCNVARKFRYIVRKGFQRERIGLDDFAMILLILSVERLWRSVLDGIAFVVPAMTNPFVGHLSDNVCGAAS